MNTFRFVYYFNQYIYRCAKWLFLFTFVQLRNSNLCKCYILLLLFFSLPFSCLAKLNLPVEKTPSATLHGKPKIIKRDDGIPSIYDSGIGSHEVCLYLSFDCHFCKESLQELAGYIAKKPKARVKIYFFTQVEEDKEKILYLLAVGSDIKLIAELAHMFSYIDDINKDKRFKKYLKTHENVARLYEQTKEKNSKYLHSMQRKFFKMKVDKTPTWIINDIIFIEGPIDNLAEIMSAL